MEASVGIIVDSVGMIVDSVGMKVDTVVVAVEPVDFVAEVDFVLESVAAST